MRGRVVQVTGLHCLVDSSGTEYRCDLRGGIKAGVRTSNSPVAVGDMVSFEPGGVDTGTVDSLFPRTSKFSRGASSTKPYERVVAVNIDQLIVVVSAMNPAIRPGFIDRAVVMSLKGNITPVVCINKVDLDSGGKFEAIAEVYEGLGYMIFRTSATTGSGIEQLRRHLDGRVSAFVGHSGVGKSSLLNCIEPGLSIKTRALMVKHDRGRHVTTAVRLYGLTSGNGHVADTPGIKELQLFQVTPAEVVDYYTELVPLTTNCRFRNCLHLSEPECAVREAVDAGLVTKLRYDGYKRLVESLSFRQG
jgi:ribosome biogenesis GTPase